MSLLAANGGQPQKQPKYAPIYQGRFYNGLNTNRSPLRAASASHIAEKFYSDYSGDALIAGLNTEVSNRLTLIRRPGNPIYDQSNTYNPIQSFNEFRVNKAQSDVFGTQLESIFSIVDEFAPGDLWSLTSGFTKGGNNGLQFAKPSNAGQSFSQPVGNSLYFANSINNKKWLTSLMVRDSAGNNNQLQGSDGLAGTYPFFQTYLVDPASGNIQQFIGVSIGHVTDVSTTSNVLTLQVTLTDDTRDYVVGTSFQLWGLNENAFLNGATVTLADAYDHTLLGRTFICDFQHGDVSSAETGQAFIIQTGTTGDGSTPYVAETGNSVPTWDTTLPSTSNDFMGGLTLDGNTVWINRGVNYGDGEQPSVMNWGLKPPTAAPTYVAAGSEVSWQQNTYYSPASVFIDPLQGNLWEITQAGLTGTSQPAWSASPTARQKVVINSVWSDGSTLFFGTDTQSPPLVAGDTVVLRNMLACGPNTGGSATTPNLDGLTLTVSATALTTTTFQATHSSTAFGSVSFPIGEYGQAIKTGGTNPPTTLTETVSAGTPAQWTCIQFAASLTWSSHHHYNVEDYLVANSCLFQLGPKTQPFIYTNQGQNTSFDYLTGSSSLQSTYKGAFPFWNTIDPTPSGPLWSSTSPTHQVIAGTNVQSIGSSPWTIQYHTINGAGEDTASTSIGGTGQNTAAVIYGNIFIPRPGVYAFTLQQDDGCFFAFDSNSVSNLTVAAGAYKVSGTYTPQGGGGVHNVTAKFGYGAKPGGGFGNLAGDDNSTSSVTVVNASWFFPQAGVYAIEIDYANWEHGGQMIFTSPGSANNIAVGRDESGTASPVFPSFTTAGAGFDSTNDVIIWGAKVVEVSTAGQQYTWNNLGPTTDFTWTANKTYTLPGTAIIDTNSSQEAAYETGITATAQPTTWSSTVGGITADNPNLKWINEGPVPASVITGSAITALSTQGWLYWLALVNTLDNTVSNVGPVSAQTGPIVNGQVVFDPGSGLDLNAIDPQADYVAIFRTVDGFTTPLLIPGFVNCPYTVPLTQYIRNGYTDTVPDAELNNLVQGAQAGENTPPGSGAQNLSYHLSRIWYSIGDTVYWTTGPLATVGNGTDGVAPGNFSQCSAQVRRLVPVAIGMLVFTVSDVYIIAGSGTPSSPILPAIPYLPGIGLANYNALDINGGLIGFFTTDKQFVMFNPSAGLSYVGYPIGNLFRLNNGQAGTSWDTTKIYVAWHTNGEDQAWYVADGVNGWYKCIATPAPEQGSVAWSPFGAIAGGCGAIKSVETSPGVHNLLVGSNSLQTILARSITATTDGGTTDSNGTTYSAYGVLGSIVLAQPGQVAKVSFVTTDSVNVGTPLTLGVIMDEALPYYTGSFDTLKHWVNDPPNLPPSKSILGQRFYMSDDENVVAYCRHLQILVQWQPESAPNELQTLTIFGAYEVEA